MFYCRGMQSKSSTSLAIISILAILGVLVIAIDGTDEKPVRKPFSKAKDQVAVNTSIKSKSEQDKNLETETIQATEIEFNGKEITISEGVNKEKIEPEQNTPTENDFPLSFEEKQINYGNLKLAGLNDFVVKPKPFDGKLFDQFDMTVLTGLDVVKKSVIMAKNGQEEEVLTAYEFNFEDKESVSEIYAYLKATIKGELGTTINETNQFGLASFYINFSEPVENAFLVVKMPENVYALSYPKVVTMETDFHKVVSKLLEGLI